MVKASSLLKRRTVATVLGLVLILSIVQLATNGSPLQLVLGMWTGTSSGHLPSNNSRCGYITIHLDPGMGYGNLMFQYATLYAMAKKSHKLPLLMASSPMSKLYDIFNLSVLRLNKSMHYSVVVVEHPMKHCCSYSPKLVEIAMKCHQHVALSGYIQSYRYWIDYVEELKREFTFKTETASACQKAIQEELGSRNLNRSNITLVAIHARQGNFAQYGAVVYGHMPTKPAYVYRAVEFFKEKYLTSKEKTKRLVFLLFGDDKAWNQLITLRHPDIFVAKERSAPVSLCMMSKADHMAIGTGTFGWWAAFVGNHEIVTYQKEQYGLGTEMEKQFKGNLDDYMLQD